MKIPIYIREGKGFPKKALFEYKVWHIINISIKDEKYKVEVSDITVGEKVTMFSSLSVNEGSWSDAVNLSPFKAATEKGLQKKNLSKWEQRIYETHKWFIDDITTEVNSTMMQLKSEIKTNLLKNDW